MVGLMPKKSIYLPLCFLKNTIVCYIKHSMLDLTFGQAPFTISLAEGTRLLRTDHLYSRRHFLDFLGASTLSWTAAKAFGTPIFKKPNLTSLPPHSVAQDKLLLAPGLSSHVIIRWGNPLNTKGDLFGTQNDYIAFLPKDQNSGTLWVNHESPDPLVLHGGKRPNQKTRNDVILERQAVGGSLFSIRKDTQSGQWKPDIQSSINQRWSAETKIPFAGHEIAGSLDAQGTLGNCSGGITPWGSILTCEENTDDYYGTVHFDGSKRRVDLSTATLGWTRYFQEPPEHYGWVVEIDPQTAKSRKLINLGRFAHEGATTTQSPQGSIVVYMGDDSYDQCLYKFISAEKKPHPDALLHGTLYVANLDQGRWLPLDMTLDPRLKKVFSNQIDLLVRTREAAALVGGTPLDRPEGIAIHPKNHAVYVSLTNNHPKKRPYGSILRIEEAKNDPASLDFKATQFVVGGPQTGFACPDNLAFDAQGNLWVTTDIAGAALGKGAYTDFTSNGLFVIPTAGDHAGKALCLARAPLGAELTGPMFTPDFKTLFLSVQHPGEGLSKPGLWGSHWPDGGIPRSAVVAIEGFS